jgi:hypothetical protein
MTVEVDHRVATEVDDRGPDAGRGEPPGAGARVGDGAAAVGDGVAGGAGDSVAAALDGCCGDELPDEQALVSNTAATTTHKPALASGDFRTASRDDLITGDHNAAAPEQEVRLPFLAERLGMRARARLRLPSARATAARVASAWPVRRA